MDKSQKHMRIKILMYGRLQVANNKVQMTTNAGEHMWKREKYTLARNLNFHRHYKKSICKFNKKIRLNYNISQKIHMLMGHLNRPVSLAALFSIAKKCYLP